MINLKKTLENVKLLRTKKAINIDLSKKGQVDAANSLQTRNDWKWHVSSSGIWFKIIHIRHNHKTSTAGDLQAQYHKSPGSFILCSAAWVRMTPQSCPDIGTALKKHSVMKQLLRITSAVAKTLLEGNWKEEYCGKIKQIPISSLSTAKTTENIDPGVSRTARYRNSKGTTPGKNDEEERKFSGDLYGIMPLQWTTAGEDIYQVMKEMSTES